MYKALFFTILAGLALGLFWPSEETKPAAAALAGPVVPGEIKETVLQRSAGGHFYANVEVNGELVRFLVDTGASGIALTEDSAERIGIPLDPNDYQQVGMGAGGPVYGQLVKLDTVSLDGKAVRGLQGSVLQGGDMNLLGQDFLGQFSVEMRGDTMRIY